MSQSTYSIRMDSDLKKEFDSICEDFGMSASVAISVFARAVVRERRIPFEIKSETKGVKRRNLLINKSRKLLERYLCNNIIYNILGMEAHIRYLNKGDETVQKALEVLEKGEAFPKPEAQLSITQNNPV